MDRYITEGDGFPGDNEFLMLIQSIIGEVAQLSSLGGENYILNGCEVIGNNVTDGWLVVDNEILRFEGGANVLDTHIHIVEDVENATYLEDLNNDNQGDSKPTYFYRKAVFGGAQGAAIAWDDLERYSPLVIQQKALTPVGAIVMWSGAVNNIPDGWALCNGANGTPDLRGKFVVGYDPGDNDYNAIGDQGGQKEVTLTEAEMPQHNHSGNTNVAGQHSHAFQLRQDDFGNGDGPSIQKNTPNNDEGWQNFNTQSSGNHSHSFNTNNKGGSQPHENRPPYFTLAFIQFKG